MLTSGDFLGSSGARIAFRVVPQWAARPGLFSCFEEIADIDHLLQKGCDLSEVTLCGWHNPQSHWQLKQQVFKKGEPGKSVSPTWFINFLLLEDSTFWLIYCLCWFFLTLISAFTRINFFCLLSPHFVVHFLTFWARCLIHMVFSFMFIFVSIFKVRYFPLCMTLEVFCSFWYNFMIFLFLSRKSAISVYISF